MVFDGQYSWVPVDIQGEINWMAELDTTQITAVPTPSAPDNNILLVSYRPEGDINTDGEVISNNNVANENATEPNNNHSREEISTETLEELGEITREGEVRILLTNEQEIVVTTSEFDEKFPDPAISAFEDPRLIQYQKVVYLQRMLLMYADIDLSLEEVQSDFSNLIETPVKVENTMMPLGDITIFLGEDEDTTLGILWGKITIRDILTQPWTIVLMGRSHDGIDSGAWSHVNVVNGKIVFFIFRDDMDDHQLVADLTPLVDDDKLEMSSLSAVDILHFILLLDSDDNPPSDWLE